MKPNLISAFCITLVLSFAVAHAGTPTLRAGMPGADFRQSEVYRDLTWYRKLKLYSAPYVNATQYGDFGVAYRYKADKAIEALDWTGLQSKVEDGSVYFATKDGSEYATLSREDSNWDPLVAGIATRQTDALQNLYIVSPERFHPKDSATPVVTWGK